LTEKWNNAVPLCGPCTFERDNTILQWAFKLNSALATAETRDLNGHTVNKCIIKSMWKKKKIEKKWQSIASRIVM
jgi:hypothetical protein